MNSRFLEMLWKEFILVFSYSIIPLVVFIVFDTFRLLAIEAKKGEKRRTLFTILAIVFFVCFIISVFGMLAIDVSLKLICNDLCQVLFGQKSSQTYSVVTEGILKEL